MAKKQRLVAAMPARAPERTGFDSRLIASAFLGASLVYLSYHPSDAANVENGDALWFGVLSLATCLFTFAAKPSGIRSLGTTTPAIPAPLWSSRALDLAVSLLASWMMFAAFANSSIGNLRLATNEAWLWVSGAGMFLAARRLASDAEVRRSIMVLLVVCATGLAVHALHQEFVTLPLNRIAFEQEPEKVLQMAGYDAPPGSSERAIFAGRLFNGGPTGTFALANSLAAILISGTLLSAGFLRFTWPVITTAQRIAWSITGVTCSAGLLATRSRTAVIATALGLVLIYVGRTSWSRVNKKPLYAAAFLTIVCGGVAGYWQPQFASSALGSLAFRFQYWGATLRMAFDRPLLGAGPGNFQAVYERYRSATTSEQIADPHNLFFETLGSGGWIALGLLIASFVFAIHFIWKGTREDSVIDFRIPSEHASKKGSGPNSAMHPSGRSGYWGLTPFSVPEHGRSVWLGATLALLLIWLFGFATRVLPDLDASLYVLPIAIVVAFGLAPSIGKLQANRLDFLMAIVLSMVLLHLMASGGWTVPGVSIIVWLSAAVVTRVECPREEANRNKVSYLAISLCLGLIGCLYLISLRPVTVAADQLAIAAGAIKSGRSGQAERALQIAANADRWSTAPAIELASLHRWHLVQVDSPGVRQAWEAELQRAKRLGGQDPGLWRVIGTQQLHLFQRYGRPEDLAAAANTFQQAVQWSPVNQWMLAQWATISLARGETERAWERTQQARRLSELGVNTERRFHFQQIYPARQFGAAVKQGPIRRSAADVLSEL